jgi:hypothetical protein
MPAGIGQPGGAAEEIGRDFRRADDILYRHNQSDRQF